MLGIEPEPNKLAILLAYSVGHVCEMRMVSPAGSAAISQRDTRKRSCIHRTFDDMHQNFEYRHIYNLTLQLEVLMPSQGSLLPRYL